MACDDCFGKCIGCDADGLPEYQGPSVPVLTAGPNIVLTSTGAVGECGTGITVAAIVPDPPIINPQYIRQGLTNFAPLWQPGPGNSPPIAPFGNSIIVQAPALTITNPDPINAAILILSGESSAVCALESPPLNQDRSYSTEWVVSIDTGFTWEKLHEVGWAVRSTGATGLATPIVNHFSKSTDFQTLLPPGGSVNVLWGVRLNNFTFIPTTLPPEMALTIGNIRWRLWSAEDVA